MQTNCTVIQPLLHRLVVLTNVNPYIAYLAAHAVRAELAYLRVGRELLGAVVGRGRSLCADNSINSHSHPHRREKARDNEVTHGEWAANQTDKML